MIYLSYFDVFFYYPFDDKFFVYPFKGVVLLSSDHVVFAENPALILIFIPCLWYVCVFVPPAAFVTFTLSLVFGNVIMMCLGVTFFMLYLVWYLMTFLDMWIFSFLHIWIFIFIISPSISPFMEPIKCIILYDCLIGMIA